VIGGLAGLGACQSSPVEPVTFYGLGLAIEGPLELPEAGPVLRILPVEVAPHLRGITIVRRPSGIVDPLLYHQWIGPLEALVEDALRAAIEKTGAARLVLGSRTPGRPDLLLRVRVARLEIEDAGAGEETSAVAELEALLLANDAAETIRGFARHRARVPARDVANVPGVVAAIDAAFVEAASAAARRIAGAMAAP
jgi:uncharacterized lipoprotein YmbA